MKTPTFLEGVVIALLAATFGSLFVNLLPALAGGTNTLHWLVTLITLSYLLYLLSRANDRVGRITLLSGWLIVVASSWLLGFSLLAFTLVNGGVIWLTRMLYFHQSMMRALADLVLATTGFAVAIWALQHSGSLFLSIWSFFLVQALFPTLLKKQIRQQASHRTHSSNSSFDKAHQAAESALRSLSSQ